MDIFKILSRSTRHAKSRLNDTSAETLPSSGQAPNPQLFGREDERRQEDGAQASRKRKRKSAAPQEEGRLPPELDLFRRRGDNASKLQRSSREELQTEATSSAPQDTSNATAQWMDEEECKKTLRRHKLKITVLENRRAEVPVTATKKKSKKRKSAMEQENAQSADKAKARQIFPQPLTAFAQLRPRYGVSKRLAENVAALGYTIPTEVQLGALPLLLDPQNSALRELRAGSSVSGENSHGMELLTVAPTGSGKTLAFLIPLIDSIFRAKGKESGGTSREYAGPRAVVIAPTRELAAQIANEGRKLCQRTGVKVALMRKGMEVIPRGADGEEAAKPDMDESEDSESNIESDAPGSNDEMDRSGEPVKRKSGTLVKADVLVSTPLVLLNALEDGVHPRSLPSVQYLVLDEADVLLDPLFREQTLALWRCCSNKELRVSFWSATVASSVEELIKATLRSRQEPAKSPVAESLLLRLVVGLKDSAIPNIEHRLIYAATESGKLLAIRQLLRPSTSATHDKTATPLRPPFLIFTQTIERALALHAELLYDIPPEAGGSTRIGVLHSSLSDSVRSAALERFRRGEVWVLVTTDLLARGVDFRGLNGVVNYDVPNSAAAYVHRVGRTGRAGREGGVAVTLWAKEDTPYIKNIANVIAASERLRGKSEADGGEVGKAQGKREGVSSWLLDSLPTPSKREKQNLKKRGVEARRPSAAVAAKDGRDKSRTRISTKSGFERREENRRRAAVRSTQARRQSGNESVSESDFEGFEG